MSETPRERFIRLIGEYEKLLDEEAFALAKRDFAYLNDRILIAKEPILQAINAERENAQKWRLADPELDDRLRHLLAHQETNAARFQELLHERESELKRNRFEEKTARGLRRSYGSGLAPACPSGAAATRFHA